MKNPARYFTTGEGEFKVKKPFIFSPNEVGKYEFPVKIFLRTSLNPQENEFIEWESNGSVGNYVTKVTLNIYNSSSTLLDSFTAYTDLETGDFYGYQDAEYDFEDSDVYNLEYVFTHQGGTLLGYDIVGRITFVASYIENHYRTKPWTITEVINRTFDLIEPLDYGEKPRFRLSGVGYDNEGNSEFIESNKLKKRGKIPRLFIWI